MGALKNMLDPCNILNPGKIFPHNVNDKLEQFPM